MQIATLGIDIGKTWFHVVALEAGGKPVLREKLNREKLLRFVATCNAALIGMQACAGSQWLARRFLKLGHEVKADCASFREGLSKIEQERL